MIPIAAIPISYQPFLKGLQSRKCVGDYPSRCGAREPKSKVLGRGARPGDTIAAEGLTYPGFPEAMLPDDLERVCGSMDPG